MKKLHSKQIAKELDVSISTVSKSFRNSLEIGEETRLKVQDLLKLYNYQYSAKLKEKTKLLESSFLK
jgi:LacI family transcriptional regulator